MGEQLQPIAAVSGTDTRLLGSEHVRVYRETNGEIGYLWNGAPILLLTTRGRKSGEQRTIPIIYTPYRDSYVIIASRGGSATHPNWYLNLLDEPAVDIQVRDRRLSAAAAARRRRRSARRYGPAA